MKIRNLQTINVAPTRVDWFDRLASVPAFQISWSPITVGQYREFMAETGCVTIAQQLSERDNVVRNDRMVGLAEEECAEFPAVYVTYDEAQAYCLWAGVRLPTVEEWFVARYRPAAAAAERELVPYAYNLWEFVAESVDSATVVLRHCPPYYLRDVFELQLPGDRKVVPRNSSNISWTFSVVQEL